MARALVLTALALMLAAGPARAVAPSTQYDAPGQQHADVCTHLVGSSAPLRFGDAEPTGFQLTNALTFDPGQCPDGSVRLDLHELLPSGLGALAFHRGGNGYLDDGNVKYGELAASDVLDPLPPPVPSSGGRGAPCTLADEPAYQVDVRSIPSRMRYKPPPNTGSGFSHYGDPGGDQGDRDDIHYTYMLWSFLDVRGGGHARILLKPGQIVRACDVAPVTMSSWDADGNVNGEVTARYVETLAGSCPIYGWTVTSHTYTTHSPAAHLIPASAPPPADPAPDPACPVAAPAAPPQVTTGSAHASGAGWQLDGSVNPVGTTTSYHFDFGTDPAVYGATTNEGSLFGGDRVQAVAGTTPTLQPSTTYHYRLVASNVHGTVLGPDATFTTTSQRPAKPVTIGRLRVAPRRLRRARSRKGATARIRYRLSARARVALTFQRGITGVRRSSGCRPRPRRHLPRGTPRCVRWRTVRGSLHQSRPAGGTSVRFGGWVGRRPLARGRYRVRAVARGRNGLRAKLRTAGFRVR